MLLPRVLNLPIRRSLHTKRWCRARELIGPPDPVSHLRPVVYDDPSVSIRPNQLNHPYSLAEFSNSDTSVEDLELQLKLQSQQLDAFNHQFWFDTNTRFESAKAAILEALPEYASALDKERALSEFYRQWVIQESERTDAYTKEWRRRSFALLLLSARVEYRWFCMRLFGRPES